MEYCFLWLNLVKQKYHYCTGTFTDHNAKIALNIYGKGHKTQALHSFYIVNLENIKLQSLYLFMHF